MLYSFPTQETPWIQSFCRNPTLIPRRAIRFTVRLLLPVFLCGTAGYATAEGPGSDAALIRGLLDRAEAALRTGQRIYPVRDSAMDLYQQILLLDSDNPDAQLGLTLIAEQYLEEAQIALDRNDLFSADIALSQARLVYPEYPGLAAIEQRLRMEERAVRTRVVLDWRLVAERSPTLSPQLGRLGGQAKAGDCRVIIQVSNDPEGRWIYQRMNAAPGPGRLRAEVRIASPAAVEVRCFPSD